MSTIQPVSPSAITSGTDPRGVAITGVPHAIASVMTRPKGSSQSIGNSTACACASSEAFSSWPISPSTSEPSGRIGRIRPSHSSISVGWEISRRPVRRAVSTARSQPFSGAARPRNSR